MFEMKYKNVINKNSAFNNGFTQQKIFDTSLIITKGTVWKKVHGLKGTKRNHTA